MTLSLNELPLDPAAEAASIVIKLGELIHEIAEANSFCSIKTINELERHGFSNAHEFVIPMLEILKRPSDSPLHLLSALEIAYLYMATRRTKRLSLTFSKNSFLTVAM